MNDGIEGIAQLLNEITEHLNDPNRIPLTKIVWTCGHTGYQPHPRRSKVEIITGWCPTCRDRRDQLGLDRG